MKSSNLSLIICYKKPEHLSTAWIQVEHIKKNPNGEYVYWYQEESFDRLTKRNCSLEELAEFEKEGFVKIEPPYNEKSSSALWMNSQGEVYIISSGEDPYLMTQRGIIKPLFVLNLPPAPEEEYEIPSRYFEDSLKT